MAERFETCSLVDDAIFGKPWSCFEHVSGFISDDLRHSEWSFWVRPLLKEILLNFC